MDISISTLNVPSRSRNGRIYSGISLVSNNQGSASQGTGADKNFIYTQGNPATLWTITHNLGKFPSVTIIDTAGTEIEGEVKHIDANNLTVEFNAGFSGTATLN